MALKNSHHSWNKLGKSFLNFVTPLKEQGMIKGSKEKGIEPSINIIMISISCWLKVLRKHFMGVRRLSSLWFKKNFENFVFWIADVYGFFILNMSDLHRIRINEDKFIEFPCFKWIILKEKFVFSKKKLKYLASWILNSEFREKPLPYFIIIWMFYFLS